MPKHSINKLLLGLIAAVALSANLCRAGEPDNGSLSNLVETSQFQNLAMHGATLQAWSKIIGKQPEVICQGATLDEFAKSVGNLYHNQFDIISPGDDRDPKRITLNMRLRDVGAIEIFNAMNLYFEAQAIPAHWKLTVNGSRPLAILTMTNPIPPRPASVQERKHTVFSIADILYKVNPARSKQTAADLTKTLEAVLDDVSEKSKKGTNGEIRENAPEIKIHEDAGILVFTGTDEETQVVRSTLEAVMDARLRKADALEKDQKAIDVEGPQAR